METALFNLESTMAPKTGRPNSGKSRDENIHHNGNTQPAPPKRAGETKQYRELTWMACQAIRISLIDNEIELRSFPFFALSLEAARQDLMTMLKEKGKGEMPYTHIYSYAALVEKSRKHSKITTKINSIDILTGAKK